MTTDVLFLIEQLAGVITTKLFPLWVTGTNVFPLIFPARSV